MLNALNALGVHLTKSHLVLDFNTSYVNSLYKYILNPFSSGVHEQIGALVHFMPLLLASVTLYGFVLKIQFKTKQNKKKANQNRTGHQTRQTPSYIYLSLGFLFCPLGFFFNVCLISQVIDFWRKRLPDKYTQFAAHWVV